MTSKEKAEYLILKYLRIDNNTKEWFNTHIAKQCALIAVDEILNENSKRGGENDDIIEYEPYWLQVKHELNKSE